MCIAAWAWQCHPTHHLLLLFNRDEYHSRPTQPALWWTPGEEDKEILGGRDELGGGTWMGCTRDGKLAFLTNVREPSLMVGAKTRGDLPVRFLQGSHGPMEYAAEIAKEADHYNGFNLIVADVNSGTMVYISNRFGGGPVIQTVAPGLHVLSNGALDSPWPKALRLEESFKRYLATHEDTGAPLKQMVEELMMDTVKADRSMVPDTGVDPEWEYKLSSIFIDTAKGQGLYGTRSMAALAAKLDGEVTFYERYLEDSLWNENLVQFQMENAQRLERNLRTPSKADGLLHFLLLLYIGNSIYSLCPSIAVILENFGGNNRGEKRQCYPRRRAQLLLVAEAAVPPWMRPLIRIEEGGGKC